MPAAAKSKEELGARLQYIFPEGATAALESLGWEALPKEEGCCSFVKHNQPRVFARTPANIYCESLMRKMLEPLDFSYEEFEDAYIAHYDGEPPIAAM